jgi:RimJ/RimL family protein N-acetyltransferase
LDLVPITRDATPEKPFPKLPDVAVLALSSTADMYRVSGCQPPWIGYLAVEDGLCVGTCAFKSPPWKNRVEIAYFTFPGYEGRGVATRMAAQLVAMARKAVPGIEVFAQTLPEENASNAILKKLGFAFGGTVDHPEDGLVWEWTLRG